MNRKQQLAMRQELKDIKLTSGCVDCGFNATADGLDFDHRDPKTKAFNVSQFSSRTVKAVRAEVKKCDVRCGTCHRIRSAAQSRVRNLIRLSSVS